MSLTLVELDRPVGERFWFPFSYEEAGIGFNNQWWYGRPVYPDSKSVFLDGSRGLSGHHRLVMSRVGCRRPLPEVRSSARPCVCQADLLRHGTYRVPALVGAPGQEDGTRFWFLASEVEGVQMVP